jgi:hypothetical protein
MLCQPGSSPRPGTDLRTDLSSNPRRQTESDSDVRDQRNLDMLDREKRQKLESLGSPARSVSRLDALDHSTT